MFDGRTKYAEAIAIYESVGAERDAATALTNVADAEFGCGNVDEAAQLGTRSLIAKRQISSKTAIALQLVNLARYRIAVGRWMVARGSAHEAVHLTKDIQHHLNFPLSLHRVAFLAALSLREPGGDPERPRTAARLLGYSDAILRRRGYSRESTRQLEYDRALAALREAYAGDELVKHLADSATMTSDRAIELALSI